MPTSVLLLPESHQKVIMTPPPMRDDGRKLSAPLERLVRRHGDELFGVLFTSVARDDEDGVKVLLGPAPRAICREVVRRIIRNAQRAVK